MLTSSTQRQRREFYVVERNRPAVKCRKVKNINLQNLQNCFSVLNMQISEDLVAVVRRACLSSLIFSADEELMATKIKWLQSQTLRIFYNQLPVIHHIPTRVCSQAESTNKNVSISMPFIYILMLTVLHSSFQLKWFVTAVTINEVSVIFRYCNFRSTIQFHLLSINYRKNHKLKYNHTPVSFFYICILNATILRQNSSKFTFT